MLKYYKTHSGNYIKHYPDNTMDFFDATECREISSVGWVSGDTHAVNSGQYADISKEEYHAGIAKVKGQRTEEDDATFYKDGHWKFKKYTDLTGEKKDLIDTRGNRVYLHKSWYSHDQADTVSGRLQPITREEYETALRSIPQTPSLRKKTAMDSTSRLQTVKTYGLKAANYFILEPAVNIGKPLLKSIRYILFVGGLTAAVYGVNNPELFTTTLKSCLPKVSIQAPDILLK